MSKKEKRQSKREPRSKHQFLERCERFKGVTALKDPGAEGRLNKIQKCTQPNGSKTGNEQDHDE